MTFKDELNKYMTNLSITNKELASISKISPSLLSRYRSGERIPQYKSKQLEAIIFSLNEISKEKNINLSEKEIRESLEKYIAKSDIDLTIFKNNFTLLINHLNINITDLSKYLGYDPSYISKIKNGTRKPQNVDDFVNAICTYVKSNYEDSLIHELIKDNNLKSWLTTHKEKEASIDEFLIKLDEFNLEQYIKSIKFDKLKVPTLPIHFPKSKNYYGLSGYKASQIDALKSICLSKPDKDIFFYSNMKITEASKDLDFTKKFMIGLAMMLKKGLHLNMIHDIDRPFNELMLGLEGWIPLYMTGQISPYYLKDNGNSLYSNLLCVSSNTALFITSITNHINTSKSYLTTKPDEVKEYLLNSKILLNKAQPLMEIYGINKKSEFLKKDYTKGNIKHIFTNLPIYTMPEDLLDKLLKRNNISLKDKNIIKKYYHKEVNNFKENIKNNKVYDEIQVLKESDFNHPHKLSLANIFLDLEIYYTYEDYKIHLNALKNTKYKNYSYHLVTPVFSNINITIINNECAVISKELHPVIHYVIKHPTLMDAIMRFKAPIYEKSSD